MRKPAAKLLLVIGSVLLAVGAFSWVLPQEAVSISVKQDLGTVDGHKDVDVPVHITNNRLEAIRVQSPPSCCTVADKPEVVLGPFQSTTITITVATHKFALGRGKYTVGVTYRIGEATKFATKDIHYDVVR